MVEQKRLLKGSAFNISFSLGESAFASGNNSIASIKATTVIPGFTFQITSVIPALTVSFSPGTLTQINLSLIAPFYSTGQNCPPQYCLHGSYEGLIFLVLNTTGG